MTTAPATTEILIQCPCCNSEHVDEDGYVICECEFDVKPDARGDLADWCKTHERWC